MKPTVISRVVVLGFVSLQLLGCTWVPLTDGGQGVRVLAAGAVSGCEKVRTVNAQTTDRVWIFARTDRKVDEELVALARNEAALANGNAVVATGPRDNGRQSFEIYRCVDR